MIDHGARGVGFEHVVNLAYSHEEEVGADGGPEVVFKNNRVTFFPGIPGEVENIDLTLLEIQPEWQRTAIVPQSFDGDQ